jgi:transcriptional regulator with XRE-family HTH domain
MARLAAELRELRAAAGLSGAEAGSRAGQISQSKISKVENGVLRAAPADVRALCRVYGVSPQREAELVQLAESLQSGTFEPRRVVLSRGALHMQQRIQSLEASASLLRSFQPCMIIGLLQTQAYARLVFGVSSKGDDIDRAVAARMQRQAALRDNATQAVLLMTEGALRWHAGGPQVMIEQLSAISEAAKLPNVKLGIIPYSRPVEVFPRHGFHLYDSDAAVFGTETGTATISHSDDVAVYEQLFTRLEALASFSDAAQAVLQRISDDYRDLREPETRS